MSEFDPEGRPNLDEVRRDLFHAEGDKVCTGRLIRRHVPALLAELERLAEENRQLRREAVTEDGRTASDLEARIERLEDGIRRHRHAKGEHHRAASSCDKCDSNDERLWALLDKETT